VCGTWDLWSVNVWSRQRLLCLCGNLCGIASTTSVGTWRGGIAGVFSHLMCKTSALLQVVPFFVWCRTIFITIVNTVDYTDLQRVAGPIALANVVNFFGISVDVLLFSVQRLASAQFFDTSLTYTAPVTPPGQLNPLAPVFLKRVQDNLNTTRLEYTAMM
jgi:hypothetical protein